MHINFFIQHALLWFVRNYPLNFPWDIMVFFYNMCYNNLILFFRRFCPDNVKELSKCL